LIKFFVVVVVVVVVVVQYINWWYLLLASYPSRLPCSHGDLGRELFARHGEVSAVNFKERFAFVYFADAIHA
jgi:hypothetical protein